MKKQPDDTINVRLTVIKAALAGAASSVATVAGAVAFYLNATFVPASDFRDLERRFTELAASYAQHTVQARESSAEVKVTGQRIEDRLLRLIERVGACCAGRVQ